ncbi:MAG: segregation/condensation protein A [Thermoleophilia bacterium]|nr:segregation/condensation protein A [Thermoleophilia bacterium]
MSAVGVRELPLDLDSFEGPFDLLLTLILKEELELVDVPVAEIVVAFVERLAEREPLDLEASGEFLVLVASLLELKTRELFPDEWEGEELEPEDAAAELAERLAAYRRFHAAAGWLAERLERERDRFFRVGPAPLAPPRPAATLPHADPRALASALRRLVAEPPAPSLGHLGTFPPVSLFLDRFRSLLRRRRRFVFEAEVASLERVEQAVAFLALLELRKADEVALRQPAPFEPIVVTCA